MKTIVTNKSILITGKINNFTRNEVKRHFEKMGASIKTSPSALIDFVIKGSKASISKIKMCKNANIIDINNIQDVSLFWGSHNDQSNIDTYTQGEAFETTPGSTKWKHLSWEIDYDEKNYVDFCFVTYYLEKSGKSKPCNNAILNDFFNRFLQKHLSIFTLFQDLLMR